MRTYSSPSSSVYLFMKCRPNHNQFKGPLGSVMQRVFSYAMQVTNSLRAGPPLFCQKPRSFWSAPRRSNNGTTEVRDSRTSHHSAVALS